MSVETKVRRRAYFVGVLLVFAAAVLWSLNGALIKVIHEGGEGPHAVTMAFYRSLIAGVVLLPLARGKLHTLRRRRGRRTASTESGNPSRNASQGKTREEAIQNIREAVDAYIAVLEEDDLPIPEERFELLTLAV